MFSYFRDYIADQAKQTAQDSYDQAKQAVYNTYDSTKNVAYNNYEHYLGKPLRDGYLATRTSVANLYGKMVGSSQAVNPTIQANDVNPTKNEKRTVKDIRARQEQRKRKEVLKEVQKQAQKTAERERLISNTPHEDYGSNAVPFFTFSGLKAKIQAQVSALETEIDKRNTSCCFCFWKSTLSKKVAEKILLELLLDTNDIFEMHDIVTREVKNNLSILGWSDDTQALIRGLINLDNRNTLSI